jgi:glycosyltransferase involved in cell wall biosynthesis
MRILHLNPFFFPYAGGIERRILEIGRRHARRHDVFLLTAQLEGTAEQEDVHGIHVTRLPSRLRLEERYNPPLVRTPGLVEAIRLVKPDVIDLHSRWAPSYAKAWKNSQAAKVFTYHNTYGEGSGALGLLSRINDWWTRRYIRRSDRINCISRFIWDDLKSHGFPEDRFALVPNGVDAAALRQLAAPTPPDAANRIVAVGRLVDVKGFDTIVRALPQIDPSIRLTICGQGPEREHLLSLAAQLGVQDRVDLPGWVPEDQKLGLLAGCLALIHPARFEAFGLAPLEALAMGAPVVAATTGGLPEVVGDAGLLVPPDDPGAIAHAVDQLRTDPELRNTLSHAGADQCAKYGWDAIALKQLKIYEQAMMNVKV